MFMHAMKPSCRKEKILLFFSCVKKQLLHFLITLDMSFFFSHLIHDRHCIWWKKSIGLKLSFYLTPQIITGILPKQTICIFYPVYGEWWENNIEKKKFIFSANYVSHLLLLSSYTERFVIEHSFLLVLVIWILYEPRNLFFERDYHTRIS